MNQQTFPHQFSIVKKTDSGTRLILNLNLSKLLSKVQITAIKFENVALSGYIDDFFTRQYS